MPGRGSDRDQELEVWEGVERGTDVLVPTKLLHGLSGVFRPPRPPTSVAFREVTLDGVPDPAPTAEDGCSVEPFRQDGARGGILEEGDGGFVLLFTRALTDKS